MKNLSRGLHALSGRKNQGWVCKAARSPAESAVQKRSGAAVVEGRPDSETPGLNGVTLAGGLAPGANGLQVPARRTAGFRAIPLDVDHGVATPGV